MRLWIFIEGIAVFAAAWAFSARAQQSGMPTVCGSIGVQVRPMTAAFAYSLAMTEIYGAIFRQPERGGPAAMAGIEWGDVVTAIKQIMAPGTTVYLNTRWNGQLIVASATLGLSNCPGSRANTHQRHATRS
jgi:hypothetical protein